MRLAVIGTPRSGNTWVRSVLAEATAAREFAAHNYLEFPRLPAAAVIQIHWYREPNFQKYLADAGVNVIALARHPLDVLVSVLHFIRHEPMTARWLEGNAEIPPALVGQPPSSDAFLNYALGFGAENLLSVTYQWWRDPEAYRARYEDFVEAPQDRFAELLRHHELPIDRLDAALAANTLRKLQSVSTHHGWQGQPGLWRKLVPAPFANEIFARHKHVFDLLGYDVAGAEADVAGSDALWDLLKK